MPFELKPEESKYFETRGAEPPATPPVQEPTPPPVTEGEPHEPVQEGQPRDDKGRFVDYGALKEERTKRQELQRQLQEFQGKYSTLETRTNEILRQIEADKNPPPQVPEWEKDPLGHTKQRIETQEERLARLEREDEQRREMTENQRAYAQFRGVVAQHTQEFIAKQPDYPQAYQHLISMQAKALQVAGFSQDQIRATLDQFETAVAQNALSTGKNPGEVAYQMAKEMGYKPAAAPDTRAAEQKLQRITEGQRTSASLSDAAGTAKPQLDAKTLAEMPDEEFAKIWSDRKKVRQIVTR